MIEDINGNLYKPTEWDNSSVKANAIVLFTQDKNIRISLLKQERKKYLPDKGTNIKLSSKGKIENAVKDFDGETNTQTLVQYYPSTDNIPGYCNSYIFPDQKTKGYLPSYGELQLIYRNRDSINKCLNACNETDIFTSSYNYYVSSTYYGTRNNTKVCWNMNSTYVDGSGGNFEDYSDYIGYNTSSYDGSSNFLIVGKYE